MCVIFTVQSNTEHNICRTSRARSGRTNPLKSSPFQSLHQSMTMTSSTPPVLPDFPPECADAPPLPITPSSSLSRSSSTSGGNSGENVGCAVIDHVRYSSGELAARLSMRAVKFPEGLIRASNSRPHPCTHAVNPSWLFSCHPYSPFLNMAVLDCRMSLRPVGPCVLVGALK